MRTGPAHPAQRVSVIVPVYNVQAYVADCLASITAQTHRELEIIVVDDGSTDGSGEVCDRLAARDPRITVVHQANRGLSGARNTGLDHATGDFLALVDGDDILAPEFVAELLADCLEFDADLVVTGLTPFERSAPVFQVDSAREVLGTPEEIERLVTGTPTRWEGPTKLYSSTLFDGLRFREGTLYEDLELCPRVLPRIRRAVVRADRLYGYRQRSGSIMDRTRAGLSPDLIEVLERNIAFTNQHFPPDAARRLRRSFLVHAARSLEYLAPGDAWTASRGFRRAHRLFISRHARSIASDCGLSPAYRGLMLLSGLSTNGFRRAFAVARWSKANLPVTLSRVSSPAARDTTVREGSTALTSGTRPSSPPRAVSFVYRGQLDIERSRIAFLLAAACRAFESVDVVHLSPGLGSDSEALRTFTSGFPGVRSVTTLPAGPRGALDTRRRLSRLLVPDARQVIGVGFSAGPFIPGRLAVWCINGIPEERLLTNDSRGHRLAVQAAWKMAGRVRAGSVVVVSQPMARLAAGRLRPADTLVIPNTVDTDEFRVEAAAAPEFLTYQGGGAPWQGLERLAQVWSALHRQEPHVRFRVISRDPRTQVLADGLPDEAIEFVSADDPREVGAWLTQARLGFLYRAPNLVNEVSWPMKFGEYLAAGVPVVLSRCGWDLEGVVRRHECGMIVRWEDPPERTADLIAGYLHRLGDDRPTGLVSAVAELKHDAWLDKLASRLQRAVEGRAV
ncbi:hypothetical protein BN11_1520009 [Nostocoides australiense Ben110]|uniref:Glycosyltransferase 2-like domain-containing protein n=1 Tax=Nostocoides australiense Ben110 TaxID=1193182 RepID=W6JUQ7_9MICO|nr:glycosyltransferase [Tetrasphaera australiensis]CCH72296.1 hypothetical protein BN11_1520009 [Tetrasphaera australiensis Ben110]